MAAHAIGPKVAGAVRRGPGRRPSLGTQAARQARAAEAPVLKAIQGDQAHYDSDQAQRQANAAGLARALGEMLKSVGPATESAYTNAAGATAGFSKGFSDAESHIASNDKASLASFLDKAGIPQDAAATALGKVGGTGDVLYGLGGYEPGSTLAREGAAFTAAANELPQVAAGLGEQNIGQLQKAQNDQDFQYSQQLANERGKIPGLTQQILQQMLTNQRNDQSLAIQSAYLGNANRASQISATGVDPVTGSAKPGYYKDKAGHVLPDGYVMRNGHPVRVSSKAGTSFSDTLGQTQSHIYTNAKALVTTEKSTDPLAGLPGHPATVTHAPPYAKASKTLFNEYKYLLRGVSASKRPAAKRLLVQTIREALAAAGIKQPATAPMTPTPYQPGVNP